MDFPKSVPGVGLVDGKFIDEDPLAATPGSLIPSAWGNAVTLEILKVIQDAGAAPAEGDLTQLSTAIKKMVTDSAVVFATQQEAEAGTSPSKAMSPLRVFQAIAKVVTQATEVAFGWLKIASTTLVNAGVDNATAISPQKLAAAAQAQPFNTVTTTGTGAAYAISPTPAAAPPSLGQRFLVSFHVASSGNPTINVSGRAAKILKQYDNAGAKVTAVIAIGQVSDIIYDGVDFVVMTPLPPGPVTVLPYRYLSGLSLGNNATTPNTTIDVAPGAARSSANNADIRLAGVIAGILQSSGAWAAGNNQNKLDTGAKANNTWYHAHAINATATGVGDILFSLSATAPTMPSGYVGSRRIGSFKTDGSGNIIGFISLGSVVLWKAPPLDVNVSGIVNSTYTISVPTGVRTLARMGINVSAAEAFFSYRSTDGSAIAPSYSAYVGGSGVSTTSADNSAMECSVLTNTSGGVVLQTELTATLRAVTYGWTELEL